MHARQNSNIWSNPTAPKNVLLHVCKTVLQLRESRARTSFFLHGHDAFRCMHSRTPHATIYNGMTISDEALSGASDHTFITADSLHVLVGKADEIRVCTLPPPLTTGVTRATFLIKVLKVLCVKFMLELWNVRGLCTAKAVPV